MLLKIQFQRVTTFDYCFCVIFHNFFCAKLYFLLYRKCNRCSDEPNGRNLSHGRSYRKRSGHAMVFATRKTAEIFSSCGLPDQTGTTIISTPIWELRSIPLKALFATMQRVQMRFTFSKKFNKPKPFGLRVAISGTMFLTGEILPSIV